MATPTETSVHLNSLRNLVTFTDQDYVVTDFQIVKELLMQLMHQFYKVSADSFHVEGTLPPAQSGCACGGCFVRSGCRIETL